MPGERFLLEQVKRLIYIFIYLINLNYLSEIINRFTVFTTTSRFFKTIRFKYKI